MTPEEAKVLLDKYNAGTASEEERAIVESWYNQLEDEAEVPAQETIHAAQEKAWGELLGRTQPARMRRLWPRVAVAASVLVAMSVCGYLLLHNKHIPPQLTQIQVHDVKPGKNQATLTLANGQKILISSNLTGPLAIQGNTAIQAKNGAIKYVSNTTGNEAVQYNTVTTARGEQLTQPILLADGSKVWLNAASSITYPTAFTGNERKVTITGEVYFEAAHNPARPFLVNGGGQTVEVLGTHFDVNSYAEEPALKTTLLEGRVKVTAANNRTAILAPGEQSIITSPDQKIKVVKADLDITMAWKDGMFRFDSTPLSSIMNQVARWYDVDIVYQDEALKNKIFFAMSTRFANVSQLLKNLEQTQEVKFEIDGKKITVSDPKH